MCHAIGRHGAELLADGAGVLTHCNAGGLATSEYGTALAVIFTAQDQGKRLHVYVDETRPLLQGARLTAWELSQRGIPATLICDSMAAQVMREGRVQAVITGADRIAANGDTANKIGTYSRGRAGRAPTGSRSTSPPRPTPSTCRSPTASRSRSSSGRPRKSRTASAAQTAPDGIARLQPGLRRDAGPLDPGDHHRTRRDRTGKPGEHPAGTPGRCVRRAEEGAHVLYPL